MTVSVILPTFNRADLVGEAIESVLVQTYGDLELIVVDDGSTDETPGLLARWKDSRLRVIRQENQGKSAARNRGLDAANGEFIAFLDSDDLWAETYLESVLEVFSDEESLDFVFSDLIRFDESGFKDETQFDIVPGVRRLPTRPSRGGTGRILLDRPFAALVPFTQFVTWLQSVVIRAERVKDIRFPPLMPLGQDYAFMLRVYVASAVCGYVDQPLAFLRRHEGNSYFRPAPGVQSPHALPTLKALVDLDRNQLDPASRKALALRTGIQLRSIGRFHYWNRQPIKAATFFWQALGFQGNRWKSLMYLLALPYSLMAVWRAPTEEYGD